MSRPVGAPVGAPVAVLGAGPAGAAAAWLLARSGHPVVLVERADHVGGLAASWEVGGMRVDLGSHRLHRAVDPEILAELRTLLGDRLQERPRNGRIRLAGRWLRFPLRPEDLARRLPPRLAAAAAVDLATGPLRSRRRSARSDDSYLDVVRSRLGPTLAEAVYTPFARKLWGREPHELSGNQARSRIASRSLGAVVTAALRPGEGRTYLYPTRGFGSITEALAAAAAGAGADIRLQASVTGVHLAGDGGGTGGPVVVTAGGGTITTSAVWSTLPIGVLASLARPAVPPEVGAAASGVETRAMVLVYLVLPRPAYTPYETHYVPGPETPISRVSEPRHYRDDPADPPGTTVLCAELPCSTGDELWQLADDEVTSRVTADLEVLGLPAVPTAELVGAAVRRIPRVYPVFTPESERAFAVLDAWAADHPRLVTFGRHGLFTHDNTHHALAMAWAAAAAARSDGSVDPGLWAQARQRFAAHVVED